MRRDVVFYEASSASEARKMPNDKTIRDAINATCEDLARELNVTPLDVHAAAVTHYNSCVDWCRAYLAEHKGEIHGKPVLLFDAREMLQSLRAMQEEPTVKISYPSQPASADDDEIKTVH